MARMSLWAAAAWAFFGVSWVCCIRLQTTLVNLCRLGHAAVSAGNVRRGVAARGLLPIDKIHGMLTGVIAMAVTGPVLTVGGRYVHIHGVCMHAGAAYHHWAG